MLASETFSACGYFPKKAFVSLSIKDGFTFGK